MLAATLMVALLAYVVFAVWTAPPPPPLQCRFPRRTDKDKARQVADCADHARNCAYDGEDIGSVRQPHPRTSTRRKIRDVIDTITSKAVLILGRFTDERKAVLDALREELRKRNYLPILFDFEKPKEPGIRTRRSRCSLAWRGSSLPISLMPKSVLQELRAIVPDLPSVPVQPIILARQEEPGMFDFYRNRPSFLTVHRYASQEQLLADLGEKVIRPAELKVLDLRGST